MIFRRLTSPTRSSLISELSYCAVDLETTGLDLKADEIVAFACVPIQRSRILVSEATYTLVRPERYRIDAMKYHGISLNDLEHAPSFKDIANKILEVLDGTILGHSVHFDLEFLKRDLQRLGLELRREALDVALIDRWLAREQGQLGQDESFEGMMSRYGLRASYRHNALADAFFVAQIFQLQMARLEGRGITTKAQLQEAVKSCRYAVW
jgi:DNA polymerase-3 subunit epsilon